MADNVILNAGTGGDTVRTVDKSGVETQSVVLDVGGTGAESLVTTSNPMPVQIRSLYYPASTANSSTAQIASGASFTGTVETILNEQAAQIEVFCDQPYTIYIYQYIDSGGTQLVSTDSFSRGRGVPFNENVTLPGNYFSVKVTNNGPDTTVGFALSTTFGVMATTPRTLSTLGNSRVGILEVGGTAVTSSSLPVSIKETQAIDGNSNNALVALQQMVQEMRIQNYLLQQGLNVKDDLEVLRKDPFFNAVNLYN